MTLLRLARTGAAALSLLAAGTGFAAAAIVTHPQPMFDHHVRSERLELWSDRPLDQAAAKRVMANVIERLEQSPLYHDDGTHRVFIVNSPWRRYLTFFWKHAVGGLNYYPFTRNVFIREADPTTDRLIGPSGRTVGPPRTLVYFIAHEIGHSLVGETMGWWRFLQVPTWLNEGMAELIARPGASDMQSLLTAWQTDDVSMNPARSGLYDRYRLQVLLALQKRGATPAELLTSGMTREQAEALLPQRD